MAAALEGQQASVVTDYILKILGLEICADIMVGDGMIRGISGGQKQRVTTGEMLVGPIRVLFMDEISTGLDSLTTFQIISSIRQSIHILNGTALVSLLQPSPETYELFEDIILLTDGQIVYQGPRKDQRQYWLIYLAIMTTTFFLRTKMHKDTVEDGGTYMVALFFTVTVAMFNGISELNMPIMKLPVFYKQRDLLFYPAWAYSIPPWILKIPITLIEVFIWEAITYYAIGYDSSFVRQEVITSKIIKVTEPLTSIDISSSASDGSKVRVAYQGLPGAYSEDADLKAYPKCETVPCDEFEAAFKAVELWLVDRAVLPIKNYVDGSIHRNYDLLLRHRLHIVGEVKLRVNHS